jgi:hypothetical protein
MVGAVGASGSSIGSLGGINDTISSIIVEQAVTVFTSDLYYGDYQILWEGESAPAT